MSDTETRIAKLETRIEALTTVSRALVDALEGMLYDGGPNVADIKTAVETAEALLDGEEGER